MIGPTAAVTGADEVAAGGAGGAAIIGI